MGMLSLHLVVDHENFKMFASLETSVEEEKDWPLADPEDRGAVAGCHSCGPWGKGGRPECSHGAGLPAHLQKPRRAKSSVMLRNERRGNPVVAWCYLQ